VKETEEKGLISRRVLESSETPGHNVNIYVWYRSGLDCDKELYISIISADVWALIASGVVIN
jgi:hypothetical protein